MIMPNFGLSQNTLTFLHNSITIFCKAVTIFSSLNNLSSTVDLLLALLGPRVDLFVDNNGIRGSGKDGGNIGKTLWDRDQYTGEKNRDSDRLR